MTIFWTGFFGGVCGVFALMFLFWIASFFYEEE
jgi:hypothetical protein